MAMGWFGLGWQFKYIKPCLDGAANCGGCMDSIQPFIDWVGNKDGNGPGK